jgi:oxalate decarboxylase
MLNPNRERRWTNPKGLAPRFAALVLSVSVGGLVPAGAQETGWPSLSNAEWGAGLPAFSYPFSKTPLITYDGGTTKQVGTQEFPVSRVWPGSL